jgi:pimeloyl-ACP methyl ester carboxylesterase
VTPAGPGPFAGLVFGHWGPGNASEFLPEAELYAEAGAVSVLIDYPWARPAPWRVAQGRGLSEPEKDRDSWIAAVVDLRRAIDVLLARPGVDAQRVGYVGHSYGAQWGAILSAVDRRMKASVLMAGVPDTESIILESKDPDVLALLQATPKPDQHRYFEINRPFDAIRYVPHAAPIPLFFQFARHERAFGEAAMKRYYEAASQPKSIAWYDTGHELNELRALADRAAWLELRLGLAPTRPLLLKRIESAIR